MYIFHNYKTVIYHFSGMKTGIAVGGSLIQRFWRLFVSENQNVFCADGKAVKRFGAILAEEK